MTDVYYKKAPQMKINVSQHVIDTAVQNDSGHCMGADAIREEIPGASSLNITVESVRFNHNGMRYHYDAPTILAVNQVKWDKDRLSVKPHQFVLRQGYMKPVEKRPHAVKRGPTKKRKAISARRTKRRYHGLRIVEVKP